MILNSRLFLCLVSCLMLANCQLINTALRLAPYLLLAEQQGAGRTQKDMLMRARQLESKGVHTAPLGVGDSTAAGLAVR